MNKTSSILFILNTLMMILDVLSIATDGVSVYSDVSISDCSYPNSCVILRNLFFLKKCMVLVIFCVTLLLSISRITSIILSRFILDLRCASSEHEASVTTQPTLQFAERIEDGLGGSLSIIWGSRIDQNQDGNEDSQSLEHSQMLSAGLSDTENIGNER